MKDQRAKKPESNPKIEVIEELLGMTRIIRKRGTPDKAIAAAEYEKMLERDLEKAQVA